MASVRDRRRGRLVDEVAVAEALEREGRVERMRLVAGDGPGEHVRRARRGLEAARAPAAVDVQARHRGLADDRRAIGRHIDDPAPVAQHAHAPEHREQLADRFQSVAGDVQSAALRVGGVGVGAGADHELALVGLADVGVDGVGHDHAREHRLDGLGDQRLQRVALERQRTPAIFRTTLVCPAAATPILRGADDAAGGLDASTAPPASRRMPVTSQFSMMSTPSASAARA